jgi:hypothetical protein
MQANLLANRGANICLGNEESLFVGVHDIDPIPVGVATTPKDAMQIPYCRRMGYLPMLRKDGLTHMQPWYIHPDAVGCMLSPESIMAASPDITSWYQEGFCDNSRPGILCVCNAAGIMALKVTMQKRNGLYYGRTNALSINHNPIWVHCIDDALALRVSTRWTSCTAQPPAAAPALIEDDKSSCGSLASATTTTPGMADDGGDSLVWNGLPSSGSNGPTCAPVDQEACPTQRPCRHKRKPADLAEILLSELWAACLGHCEEWQLEALPNHANGLPPKFNLYPLRFVDHKIQACLCKQPANKTASKLGHPGQQYFCDFRFIWSSTSDYSRSNPATDRITHSVDGFNCYLLVVDEFLHYAWVFLCASKEPPIDKMFTFLWVFGFIEGGVLQCEQGRELSKSTRWRLHMLMEFNCKVEPTGADSPSQNGGVERFNQTLGTMTRALLYGASLPAEYWSYALVHLIYLLNHLVHSHTKCTPYEVLSGTKPNLSPI